MKNENLRAKKLAKKRRQHADYKKRNNLNKQAVTDLKYFRKDVVAQVLDSNGKPVQDNQGFIITKKTGERIIPKKIKRERKGLCNKLPLRVKFTMSKEAIKEKRTAIRNIFQTAT